MVQSHIGQRNQTQEAGLSRIPGLSDAQMESRTQKMVERMETYGPFENWSRVAAYCPPVLDHVADMLIELREADTLPRRALELAMVAVSKLNACDYCVSHHAPSLRVEGLSPEGVARLLEMEDHPELDDCDKAVVRYTQAVTQRAGRMRDAELDALRQWFSDAQIVELTWRIALCGAFNRFNEALQIPSEDTVQVAE